MSKQMNKLSKLSNNIQKDYDVLRSAIASHIANQLIERSKRYGHAYKFWSGNGEWTYKIEGDYNKFGQPKSLPFFKMLDRYLDVHGWDVIPTGYFQVNKDGSFVNELY